MLHCYMLYQYLKATACNAGVKVFLHALTQLLSSSRRLSLQIMFVGTFYIALLHTELVYQVKAFDARLKYF